MWCRYFDFDFWFLSSINNRQANNPQPIILFRSLDNGLSAWLFEPGGYSLRNQAKGMLEVLRLAVCSEFDSRVSVRPSNIPLSHTYDSRISNSTPRTKAQNDINISFAWFISLSRFAVGHSFVSQTLYQYANKGPKEHLRFNVWQTSDRISEQSVTRK